MHGNFKMMNIIYTYDELLMIIDVIIDTIFIIEIMESSIIVLSLLSISYLSLIQHKYLLLNKI